MVRLSPKYMIIGAVAVTITTAFFFMRSSTTDTLVEAEKLSSTPDYFITTLNAKEFDENGALQETLTAVQTLHYNQDSRTLLESPTVKRHDIEGSWNAESKKGIIEDGSNDILLTEDAVAVKQFLESPDITLKADNIHYLDNNQSLTSTGNATLYSEQGTTTAKTITTYINSEEVVMTGSVRGQYETAH